MPDPQTCSPPAPCPARWRGRATRVVVMMAVAGLSLLPSVVPDSSSAAASANPASPCRAAFTASAGSDLVVLRQLSVSKLARTEPERPDMFNASSRAGLYAGRRPMVAARAGVFATAEADQTHVLRVAPPDASEPAVRSIDASDMGNTHTAQRDLRALARLVDPETCSLAASEAGVSLHGESHVTGSTGSKLSLAAGSWTNATSGLRLGPGGYASVATATVGVGDLALPGGATLRVSTEPSLEISASGVASTSTVRYTPPAIAVSGPEEPARFRPVATTLDLPSPEGVPIADSPAANLLTALGGAVPEASKGERRRGMLLRIVPGTLGQQDDGWLVHALACAARIAVILQSTLTDGSVVENRLAEISIGNVEAVAFAPSGGFSPSSNAGDIALAPPTGGRRAAVTPTPNPGPHRQTLGHAATTGLAETDPGATSQRAGLDPLGPGIPPDLLDRSEAPYRASARAASRAPSRAAAPKTRRRGSAVSITLIISVLIAAAGLLAVTGHVAGRVDDGSSQPDISRPDRS